MLTYEPVDTVHIQMLTMASVWLLFSLCGGGVQMGSGVSHTHMSMHLEAKSQFLVPFLKVLHLVY